MKRTDADGREEQIRQLVQEMKGREKKPPDLDKTKNELTEIRRRELVRQMVSKVEAVHGPEEGNIPEKENASEREQTLSGAGDFSAEEDNVSEREQALSAEEEISEGENVSGEVNLAEEDTRGQEEQKIREALMAARRRKELEQRAWERRSKASLKPDWTRIVIYAFFGLALCAGVLILSARIYGFSLLNLLPWGKSEDAASVSAEGSAEDNLWRYMDAGEEPGVGNVWTTPMYDASAWKFGDGLFAEGRGEGKGNQTVALQSRTQDGGYASTYFFRKEFQVDSTGWIQAISGTIRYSDSVLVYINGQIIYAGNVPEGGYLTNQDTGCADDPGEIHEDNFTVTDLPAFRSGTNVLAVELHQADASAENACFELPYFNLLSEEVTETAPDVRQVFLEVGENQEEIYVNWLTDSDDYYKVGYMPADDYEDYQAGDTEWDPFFRHAEYVLMGRTYDDARGCYRNRALLSHLKTGEEYLYRIVKVGSKLTPEPFRFTAPGNHDYAFAVFGEGIAGGDAQACVDKAAGAAGGISFVMAGSSFSEEGQEFAKEIPSGVVRGKGEYYFTCQDTLIMVLDSDNADFGQHETFVQETLKNVARGQVIVVMAEAPGGDTGYKERLEELGADLVITQAEQDILVVTVSQDEIQAKAYGA